MSKPMAAKPKPKRRSVNYRAHSKFWRDIANKQNIQTIDELCAEIERLKSECSFRLNEIIEWEKTSVAQHVESRELRGERDEARKQRDEAVGDFIRKCDEWNSVIAERDNALAALTECERDFALYRRDAEVSNRWMTAEIKRLLVKRRSMITRMADWIGGRKG